MPELTPVQSQVLAGLLAGKSVSAVAREHGIHRSTIYTWRQEQPYFTIALDQARSRHQTALFDHVQDLAEQALDVVTELLTAEDAHLRLRAAQVILRVAKPAHLSRTPELRWSSKPSPITDPPGTPRPQLRTRAARIRHNSTESDTSFGTKPQFTLLLRVGTQI